MKANNQLPAIQVALDQSMAGETAYRDRRSSPDTTGTPLSPHGLQSHQSRQLHQLDFSFNSINNYIQHQDRSQVLHPVQVQQPQSVVMIPVVQHQQWSHQQIMYPVQHQQYPPEAQFFLLPQPQFQQQQQQPPPAPPPAPPPQQIYQTVQPYPQQQLIYEQIPAHVVSISRSYQQAPLPLSHSATSPTSSQHSQQSQHSQHSQQSQQHPDGYRIYNNIFDSHSDEEYNTKRNIDRLKTALKNPIPPYSIATTNTMKKMKTTMGLRTSPYDTTNPQSQQDNAASNNNTDNGTLTRSTSANSVGSSHSPPTTTVATTNSQPRYTKNYRTSRRRHKNSHLGCATCKSRRIKCDENLPQCKNCVRARLRCAYLALDDEARQALKVAQEAHALRLQNLDTMSANTYSNISNGKSSSNNHSAAASKSPVINTRTNSSRANTAPIAVSSINPDFYLASSVTTTPVQQSAEIPKPHQPYYNDNNDNDNNNDDNDHNNDEDDDEEDLDEDEIKETETNTFIPYKIQTKTYEVLRNLVCTGKVLIPLPEKSKKKYTPIQIRPGCISRLNKNWEALDEESFILFENGFENPDLYPLLDRYSIKLMEESVNNIFLFDAFLTSTTEFLKSTVKDDRGIENLNNSLNKNMKLVSGFIKGLKINYPKKIDMSSVEQFYEIINISLAKFQTFQALIPQTFYGDIAKHVDLTNDFFNFTMYYANSAFLMFHNEEYLSIFKDSKAFNDAKVLNSIIHMFIIYYVQGIKYYHTSSYNTVFLNELLAQFKAIKPIVIGELNKESAKRFHEIETFLFSLTQYFNKLQADASIQTNRVQIMFYILKKWMLLAPEEYLGGHNTNTFEEYLFHLYCHCITVSLNSIFPEVKFFYLYGFNTKYGYRNYDEIAKYFKQNSKYISDEHLPLVNYGILLVDFFRKRFELISGYLRNVSKLPAKILLDKSNKEIMRNLIKEVQLKSFSGLTEIPQESFPSVDTSSNFYNKETNSITIPSLVITDSFNNFDNAHLKRSGLLEKALQDGLYEIDLELLKLNGLAPFKHLV